MNWLLPVALSFAVMAIIIEISAWSRQSQTNRWKWHIGLVIIVTGLAWFSLESQFNPPLKGAPTDTGISFAVGWVIVLTFIGVLLGISGKYLFETEGTFNWLDFLRPFAISPVVLLPLIGTLDHADVQIVQMVSLFILGFQNGFFWQKVMQDVRITGKSTSIDSLT